MAYDIYETQRDAPEEPTDPNEVRLALSWLFSSDGTLDFEDAPWIIDADGDNGFEFRDEESETTAYIPTGTDGDITGGGSLDDTRTDVSDDGEPVVEDTEDINFGANVSVTDDGDGTVTVEATDTDTDTHADVADGGATVVTDVDEIDFGDNVSVTDTGDGTVTVDATDTNTDTDTRVETQDAGETAFTDTETINFDSATAITVSDDGSGAVTIGADDTDTHITVTDDGADVVTDADAIDFGDGLTASVDGDGAAVEAAVTESDLDGKSDSGHALGGAEHESDTLANLNSKIDGATLDDEDDSRPPDTHGDEAHDEIDAATWNGYEAYVQSTEPSTSEPYIRFEPE